MHIKIRNKKHTAIQTFALNQTTLKFQLNQLSFLSRQDLRITLQSLP